MDESGDISDALVRLDKPVTRAQRYALMAEFIRLRRTMDHPDTYTVVQTGVRNVLGDEAGWIGYQLIEF